MDRLAKYLSLLTDKEIHMIEREKNLNKYKWTAKRFKINEVTPQRLKEVATYFIKPVKELIRNNNNCLAGRWYWSWRTYPDGFYLRMYFLSHKNHLDEIWERIEEFRQNTLNELLQSAKDEDAIKDVEKDLEFGIFLEYMSEIALMYWIGEKNDDYKSALHHLWQPLLIKDELAHCWIVCHVGQGWNI